LHSRSVDEIDGKVMKEVPQSTRYAVPLIGEKLITLGGRRMKLKRNLKKLLI